jgi:molybdopterin-guanine dinucleotide biosynthesis protein MobB
VIEKLIARLKGRGFRIGVIKHLGRDDIEIDEPGKDTFRDRSKGAQTVILSGRKRLALFANLSEEMSLDRLLDFFQDFDLIFLEGYFQEGLSRLEVQREESGEWFLKMGAANVFREVDALAIFIEEKLLRKEIGVAAEAIRFHEEGLTG